MEENNWKLEDVSVEDMKNERSVSSSIKVVQNENMKLRKDSKNEQSISSSINDVHSENVKLGKDFLIHQIQT